VSSTRRGSAGERTDPTPGQRESSHTSAETDADALKRKGLRTTLLAILWAGLVAGALDIIYVIVYYAFAAKNVGPTQILHGIAAGWLGRDAARAGGTSTAVLGLALHFLIALVAAAVFQVASRRLRVLVERPWISGFAYGIAVWLCMNLVVLPLSANPPKSFPSPAWIPVLVAHVVCVGWPIALIVRRFAR
jgi:hypothetical protein